MTPRELEEDPGSRHHPGARHRPRVDFRRRAGNLGRSGDCHRLDRRPAGGDALPLLALAGVFEAVFALHTGVERVGRYIQVFYESETPDSSNWEYTAMAFGRPFPAAPAIRCSGAFSGSPRC